jgi:hypothetical protein
MVDTSALPEAGSARSLELLADEYMPVGTTAEGPRGRPPPIARSPAEIFAYRLSYLS